MGRDINYKQRRDRKGAVTGLLILALLLVMACKATTPFKPAKAVPPTLPVIEPHVEPLAAAVPSKLPQVNFNDPIELTILQAQMRFEKGEELYRQGFLKRAKDEFNSAI